MTTIGPSLIIKGEVTSNEDVTIHGQVHGTISMQQGALLIAPTANVEAEAEATRLTIHGTFSGEIVASERVELTGTAKVTGKLTTPAIVVQDGAVFNGAIEVEGRRKPIVQAAPAA